MTVNERKEWDLKLRKIDAEISNLNAMTTKISTGNRWSIAVVASGLTLAIVAVAKAFL